MSVPARSLPLRIGALALGEVPRLAVPFDDSVSRAEAQELLAQGLDVAELRVDLFSTREPARVRAELAKYEGLATLATIRLRTEGGGWDGSEAERAALFASLVDRVDAVDVELAARAIRDEVRDAARAAGRLVIASHHDFVRTPESAALAAVVAAGRDFGADVIKIATAIAGAADVRALARLLVEHADVPMIVIGMGEAAAATRVLFPALGSLLTYASAGRATAPGQLPFDEMRALLRRLFPAYAAARP
jgi:3-dehydroquinate dehydratase-1